MTTSSHSIFQLLKQAASEWITLGISRLGAAIAFYAIFAIAPLFVIVLALAGFFIKAATARDELYREISGTIGTEASAAIKTLVSAIASPKHGALETAVAALLLFIGATGLFVHLQHALNTIWGIERPPGHALANFAKDRIRSFLLIMGIALLLLLSLVLNGLLSPAGRIMNGLLPVQQVFVWGLNWGISFVVITLLLAMFFKMLPDVKIPWRDVRMGAFITALFFCLGKILLTACLGNNSVSSRYGAAGSLVIMLIWVYYSSQIVMIGAKFTQLYSVSQGSRPVRGTAR